MSKNGSCASRWPSWNFFPNGEDLPLIGKCRSSSSASKVCFYIKGGTKGSRNGCAAAPTLFGDRYYFDPLSGCGGPVYSHVCPGLCVGGNGFSPDGIVTVRGSRTPPPWGPRSLYSPALRGVCPGLCSLLIFSPG